MLQRRALVGTRVMLCKSAAKLSNACALAGLVLAPYVVFYAVRTEQHFAQRASVRLLIRDVDASQLRTEFAEEALLVLGGAV